MGVVSPLLVAGTFCHRSFDEIVPGSFPIPLTSSRDWDHSIPWPLAPASASLWLVVPPPLAASSRRLPNLPIDPTISFPSSPAHSRAKSRSKSCTLSATSTLPWLCHRRHSLPSLPKAGSLNPKPQSDSPCAQLAQGLGFVRNQPRSLCFANSSEPLPR